ncbi:MAG: CoA transferase [Rhodospirillales bacterium]|nr:CoA transferase [Rhodospirillales bacterium]
MSAKRQALEGVNVAVFGGYAAGPWIGKVMANFGARVVHVESKDRPDGFRLQYPPFKDGKQGINRGGCFTYFNDSKHGITLDAKKPGGVELGRRLLDWCDVVVENMRPGVMKRIGFGYEEAIKTNPGLIMISTCNMGQTGPRANAPGFGSQLSALAGFCGLTGERNGSPMLLYGPYIDFVAALYGASVALAALDRRRRTGKGALVDISQYECGIDFISGAMLDFHTTGRIAERSGNDDPVAAPHGAYPCRGDDAWLAVSCWSDDEFARLAATLGHPEWSDDPRFAGTDARRANKAELDELISNWTKTCESNAAAEALQQAQVHCYPVNSIADLFTDPQLAERKTWRKQHHEVIGDQSYYFPGFDLSATPGVVTKAAPLLGGENDIVYRDFLGLSEEEYEAYKSQGVIG